VACFAALPGQDRGCGLETFAIYHLIGPEVFRTISKAVSPLLVFHCSSCNHTTANSRSRRKPFVRFREKVSVSPKKQMRVGSVDERRNVPGRPEG
jgi:hypothetical protein